MKRITLLLVLTLLAMTVISAERYLSQNRAITTSAIASGIGAGVTSVVDTSKIGELKAMSNMGYRFLYDEGAQSFDTDSLRGSRLLDTVSVVFKSRIGDLWHTIDSFKIALPDTTLEFILPALADTAMFGDLYSIIRFADTTSDSIFTIYWQYELIVFAKD